MKHLAFFFKPIISSLCIYLHIGPLSAGWRNPAVANVPAFGDATGGAYIECSASSVQSDSQVRLTVD